MKFLKAIIGKVYSKIVRKLFDLPDFTEITNVSFKITKAVKGPSLRVCGMCWSPTTTPPYTPYNWHSKICAIVVFGFKITNFTAILKGEQKGFTGHVYIHSL